MNKTINPSKKNCEPCSFVLASVDMNEPMLTPAYEMKMQKNQTTKKLPGNSRLKKIIGTTINTSAWAISSVVYAAIFAEMISNFLLGLSATRWIGLSPTTLWHASINPLAIKVVVMIIVNELNTEEGMLYTFTVL